MPKIFAVPAHDLELCDRVLVPVLDLAQDRLDVFSHYPRAQTGIADRNHSWADLVAKISSRSWGFRGLGVEGDFAAAHFSLLEKDDGLIRVVQVVFRVDYGMNPAARRSKEEAS